MQPGRNLKGGEEALSRRLDVVMGECMIRSTNGDEEQWGRA